MLLDEGQALFEAFEANGTPSALVIATDGTIGSWVGAGSAWIERFVEPSAAGDEEPSRAPHRGRVPDVELRRLTANRSCSPAAGGGALLLFWNPGCGFCRSMRDEVLAWEASTQARPAVCWSSRPATRRATRAEGFTSLVLLDETF